MISGARKSEFPAQEIGKQFLCAPKPRKANLFWSRKSEDFLGTREFSSV